MKRPYSTNKDTSKHVHRTGNIKDDLTGHATLAEVQRYTKAADRKRLAREAMKKLIEGGS